MRIIQSLETATMVNEYMLLVRNNIVINTNWGDYTTGTISVGTGITAYLFTALADLESYATANGWELPTEQY